MELRNWKLQPVHLEDTDGYHRVLGKLSDFLTESKPGETCPIFVHCFAVGEVYGYPNPDKFKDGDTIKTTPVLYIKCTTRSKDSEYIIVTESGSEYHTRDSYVNKQFAQQAWTFGTPHAICP